MLAVKRRSGFTLIELLVVIAIIGILAGLLLAGVMVFLQKGPEVSNRNDMSQLAIGLDKFKTMWKISDYPRNTLKLCSNYSSYNTNVQLDQDSIRFLSKMWPNLTPVTWVGINWANRTGATAPVYGNAANPTIDILDGDQCLVFFLGGPPMPGGVGLWGGFSTDATNPMANTVDKFKCKDFEAGRLFIRPSATLTIGGVNYATSTAFLSYMDSYSDPTKPSPFVYFSSTNYLGRPDGYDRTANSVGITPILANAAQWKFQKSDTFQLISAGADGIFGPGGQWTEINAGAYSLPPGKDDMTNVSNKLMGN